MTLKDFFSQPESPTQTEFADRIGVGKTTLNHYVLGRRRVPGRIARLIIEHSEGAIDWDDLYPPLEPQADLAALEAQEPSEAVEPREAVV